MRRKIRKLIHERAACDACAAMGPTFENPREGKHRAICAPCFDAEDVRRTIVLKCWPPFFEALVTWKKTFELRKDDRRFQVGDLLHIQEWEPRSTGGVPDPSEGRYTGREARMRVTYKLTAGVLASGIAQGYCILSVVPAFMVDEEDEVEVAREIEASIQKAVTDLAHHGRLPPASPGSLRELDGLPGSAAAVALVAARIFDLQKAGETAHASVSWKTAPAGETVFTISVRRGDGRLEHLR